MHMQYVKKNLFIPVCYSDKHFVNSSAEMKSVQNFRTSTIVCAYESRCTYLVDYGTA